MRHPTGHLALGPTTDVSIPTLLKKSVAVHLLVVNTTLKLSCLPDQPTAHRDALLGHTMFSLVSCTYYLLDLFAAYVANQIFYVLAVGRVIFFPSFEILGI